MRRLVLALAATVSALAAATPATAQYSRPGYGRPGYDRPGYGQNNWGEVQSLQARLDAVARQIDRLDRNNALRGRTADRLRYDVDNISRSLHRAARNGLNGNEANQIRYQIENLERQVQFQAGRRRY